MFGHCTSILHHREIFGHVYSCVSKQYRTWLHQPKHCNLHDIKLSSKLCWWQYCKFSNLIRSLIKIGLITRLSPIPRYIWYNMYIRDIADLVVPINVCISHYSWYTYTGSHVTFQTERRNSHTFKVIEVPSLMTKNHC